jgi:hypothetical protein
MCSGRGSFHRKIQVKSRQESHEESMVHRSSQYCASPLKPRAVWQTPRHRSGATSEWTRWRVQWWLVSAEQMQRHMVEARREQREVRELLLLLGSICVDSTHPHSEI